jgi:hypothetical protein
VNRHDLVRSARSSVFYIDRKIGAQQGAQSAVDTVRVVEDFGRVIALAVGVIGHDQHVLGAEFNAETAPFAPLLDDVNGATGYLDAVPIERLSPKDHKPSWDYPS